MPAIKLSIFSDFFFLECEIFLLAAFEGDAQQSLVYVWMHNPQNLSDVSEETPSLAEGAYRLFPLGKIISCSFPDTLLRSWYLGSYSVTRIKPILEMQVVLNLQL